MTAVGPKRQFAAAQHCVSYQSVSTGDYPFQSRYGQGFRRLVEKDKPLLHHMC
jgi:hypothetical protein